MTPRRNLHLIVNPISGRGAAGKKADRLAVLARAAGLNVQRVDLGKSGDGAAAARALAGVEADIAVVGGDGTFNEVLNGQDPRTHRLLFLPCGTVNVVAKEFGISSRVDHWWEQMTRGRERVFDTARCNGRQFFIVAGGGLDGFATRLVALNRRGNLRFADWWMPALRAALKCTDYRIHVHADGFDPAVSYQYVVVGNCMTYGGPCVFASDARPDDGLLDVCAVRFPEHLHLASTTFAALLRRLRLLANVDYGQVERVVLDGSADYYQFDGEYGGELPAEITLVPRSLRMIVPR